MATIRLPGQALEPSLDLLHQWPHSLLHLLHSRNIEPQLLQLPECNWLIWLIFLGFWFFHLCCCILFSCKEQVHDHKGSNKGPISCHKGFGPGSLITILTSLFSIMMRVRPVLLKCCLSWLHSDSPISVAFFLKIGNWRCLVGRLKTSPGKAGWQIFSSAQKLKRWRRRFRD